MDRTPDTTDRHVRRFECACGRRVVTEEGSAADIQRCCSRCRRDRTSLVAATLATR